MSHQQLTVLVVGATGSIGRLVVEEAGRNGHPVRALAPLDADPPGTVDRVHNLPNMPPAE